MFCCKKMGLEEVATIDYSDGNYRFDYRRVWRVVATGDLRTARDSGCSCPTPFEDFKLKDLEPASLMEIEEEVTKEVHARDYDGDDPTDFLRAIRIADDRRRRHEQETSAPSPD